jgi:NTE family protein
MWQFLKRLKILRKQPPRKLGLALSGGGARGLAHIGVLKVLEQEGIRIDYLAGTSAGGLISALYAAGLSASEMEEEALQLSNPRRLVALVDRALPRRGLLEGQRVMEYLAQWLGGVTFDQLHIPLALVAVDLNEQQKVIMREGLVLDAVRATIALPGFFTPLERDGQLLVDGGLLDNLPVDAVHQMGADVVIAVDISTNREVVALVIERLHGHRFVPDGLVDLVEVLWCSMEVLIKHANRHALEETPPDLLIHPAVPPDVTVLTGFLRAEETIAAGEQAAIEALPQIQALLGSSTS